MAFPFFSPRKGGEKEPVSFADPRSGTRIETLPSTIGSATIWDKDILICLASLIRMSLDAGQIISSTFAVTAADLLEAIQRGSGGRDYRELECALDRLVGTRFKTNLPTGMRVEKQNFSVLTAYEFRESRQGRMTCIYITVSEWFLRSVQSKTIVTIDPDYFLLASGIARRVYELARKHLGDQPSFQIKLTRLQQKCGSTRAPRQFKHNLRRIIGERPTRLLDLWAFQDGETLFAFQTEFAASAETCAAAALTTVPAVGVSAIPRSAVVDVSANNGAVLPSTAQQSDARRPKSRYENRAASGRGPGRRPNPPKRAHQRPTRPSAAWRCHQRPLGSGTSPMNRSFPTNPPVDSIGGSRTLTPGYRGQILGVSRTESIIFMRVINGLQNRNTRARF